MFLYTGQTRNMAIAVKSGLDPSLEYNIAKILALDVRPGDILIPAPNHNGSAEYTLRIAKEIEKMSDAKVCDCINVLPHDTGYSPNVEKTYKQKAIVPYIKAEIIQGNRYLLVDNVIDTGATFDAIAEIISELKPLIFASRGKKNGMGMEWILKDNIFISNTND